MDRRCYSCASKFTLFKKELSCKNCLRSTCAGCLKYTIAVPRCDNTSQKVCGRCYEDLKSDGSKNSASKWSPPENYKKRIASLETRQNASKEPAPPKVSQSSSLFRGLSKEDQAIAERLERLKMETKPKSIPSVKEIETRLAGIKNDPQKPIPSVSDIYNRLSALQGKTQPTETPKPPQQRPDLTTQTEQVNSLITQMTEEIEIDSNTEPQSQSEGSDSQLNNLNKGSDFLEENLDAQENEKQLEEEKSRILEEAMAELKQDNIHQEQVLQMARRLACLKGEDPNSVSAVNYKPPDSDEETEEEAVQRILKQLSEEAQLDEASNYNIPPECSASLQKPKVKKTLSPAITKKSVGAHDSDDEELPWCCICNHDATIRCLSCDDDLYCSRCFREGHDAFDRKEHKITRYQPPKKPK
ncbi:abscission/NoCut checkpoint regulator [Polypterus senegalus]|uniref:abscission/NoCut checkpoint regulator n=1 Tax=Polypterus senegalus TaxID=55291 RepID=UPI0019662C8F|nr:abscission/NoCut checkpoint regulator [Polypterus senegalus]